MTAAERTARLREPCDAALIPLAQLFAADFPEITFPPGKNLVQLFWRGGLWGHDCMEVFWQQSANISDIQASPTAELDRSHMIAACVLDPERICDFPWYEELPDEILERLHEGVPEPEEAEETADELDVYDSPQYPPSFYWKMSAAPGFKVGGSMNWSTTNMPDVVCPDCGAPSTLLLQLDTYEWAPGQSDSHWCPLEDRQLVPGTPAYKFACEPTGLTIGGSSHGGVFVCSANPAHAAQFRCQ
ncbi:hypothetical protein [Nocardia beijingensis]|uniref:DUF1963 domain-containing protein n=1 Tax=Nocardia beijingensis TaxID=95162 RepID=A0ABW7W8R6_9NOCA